MSQYFECLRCGTVSRVEKVPPRCRSCGYGTGVLHSRKPAGRQKKPEANGSTDEGQDGDKSGDPAAVLADETR